MKNKHTLLIATLLLVLCVIQKEARYKAMTGGNVEKIYNSPEVDKNGALADEQIARSSEGRQMKISSRKDLFDFASLDSTSQSMSSAKLLNNSLLNISSTKMLNN
ncbi:hypothetical protein [Dyadobacter sp. CY326]|uniref:hypothetical protein n=1 Tax=Dyadobacter sp. CY326 TaxID=2907300 RepID=UPI001F363BBF|nr:hypothetical protein [Dyadobacter sp. CY326]MCE7068268.1 hypothetical protein [Dyadobacter sp. CY326]